MDRYSRIKHDASIYYCSKSRIVVLGSAILTDNKNNDVLAQIKWQNLNKNKVRALIVTLSAYNVIDEEICEVPFQYLDLQIETNNTFGSNIPIKIPSETRNFSIKKIVAVFENDEKTENSFEDFEIIKQEKLSGILDSKQLSCFRQLYGIKMQYIPHKIGDIWQCACGSLNNSYNCVVCNNDVRVLIANSNTETLNEIIEKKKKEEEVERIKRKEEQKIKERIRKKRIQKVTILLSGALIVAVLMIVGYLGIKYLYPKNVYNNAVKKYNEENYAGALADFNKIEGYSDTEAYIKKTVMKYIEQQIENGNFENAKTAIEEYDDLYEELIDKSKIVCYMSVILIDEKKYDESAELLVENRQLLERMMNGDDEIPQLISKYEKYYIDATIDNITNSNLAYTFLTYVQDGEQKSQLREDVIYNDIISSIKTGTNINLIASKNDDISEEKNLKYKKLYLRR